ncbi:MAG: Bax inhibitor-1/YccA family protein [Pseudomonadota bacterium]
MVDSSPNKTAPWGTTAPTSQASPASQAAMDEGLRRHFLKIYNYMTTGLLVSAVTAWAVAFFEPLQVLFFAVTQTPAGYVASPTLLGWVAILAPLAIIFIGPGLVKDGNPRKAMYMYLGFTALMGISLAQLFIVYTGMSIVRTLLVTAGAFAGLSLFGYTTKRNLSGWGQFLMVGLIGIIIASLVNFFVQSSMIAFAVSVIGVLIFAGLIAYDTQRIRRSYYEHARTGQLEISAVFDALSLYLNFINLFVLLMRFIGERR